MIVHAPGPVDTAQAALAGLASASGLAAALYPGAARRPLRKRLEKIAKGELTQGVTDAARHAATDAATQAVTDAAMQVSTDAATAAATQAATHAAVSAAVHAAHHAASAGSHGGHGGGGGGHH